MTVSSSSSDSHLPRLRPAISPVERLPFGLVLIIAALIAYLPGLHLAANVWNTGHFNDTDDAMRMVQVRDLIAGQSWFDLSAHRLYPAQLHSMHWSRIVDVPLALLVHFLELFLSPVMAERTARIAFPVIMIFFMLAGVARAAKTLMGPRAVLPALLLGAFSSSGIGQFQPGRVDHHAPQIVLLIFMVAFTVEAISAGKHKFAGLAAIMAALSLGIGIENILFIGAIYLFWVIIWLVHGNKARKVLFVSGAGLIVALTVVFVLTIGPSHWFVPACDALSIAYFVPIMAGAAGCCLIAMIPAPVKPTNRLLVLACLSLACGGCLALLFPQCLSDPFGVADPLFKRYWLNNVSEARTLHQSFIHATSYTAILMGPALVGALFAFRAVWKEAGESRQRWIAVSVCIVAGLITACWQIRAGTSLAPLATLGCVWAVVQLRVLLEHKKIQSSATLALAAALPFSAMVWIIVNDTIETRFKRNADAAAPAATENHTAVNCFASDNFTEASRLKPGLIVAPLEVGAHMLAHTHHSVLSAAYHRNNTGNTQALGVLFGSPATAESKMRLTGADYVAICMGTAERNLLKLFAPEGLATHLANGEIPAWLTEISTPGSLLRVFQLNRGKE